VQDKPRKPQQYIDGFINNRPRRPVVNPSAATVQQRLRSSQGVPTPSVRQTLGNAAKPVSLQHGRPQASLGTPSIAPASQRLGRKRPKSTAAAGKKRSWKTLTKRGALVVLALFMMSGGWLGWKVYRNSSKVFGNDNPLHMLSAFKPVPLKGQETGHVNILLAGNSADRSDGGGGNLTDSIMVMSVNTKTNEAFMLSIPRDLWVNIPGIGGSKINAANTVDDFSQEGYAKGGMGMLEKVISDNFGITLNYYALVNYKAFQDSVDTVGGIDVNIQSKDSRGIYDPSFRAHEGGPLKLSNGVNHLNGQVALNLARARGDPFNGVRGAYGFPESDFTRTEHQRQMMIALKEKAMSMGVLSNPTKVGKLMDAAGNNVSTDLKVNELLSLYHLAKKIDTKSIQSLSLNNAEGKNLLSNYTTSTGQSALVPAAGPTDFSAIQAYVQKVINATPVTKEAANVVVLNGGQIPGLARLKGDQVAKKGAVVTSVGDAPKQYTTTTIIDNSGGKKSATKKMLQDLFKGSTTASDAELSKQYTADFIVILGGNEKAPTDQQSTDSDTTNSGSTSEI